VILLGTLVNAAAIIVGALIGRLLSRIPDSIRHTVMQGIGLAVILLGIKMSLGTGNFLLMIVSIVVGAIVGEWIGIEKGLDRLGKWLERKVGGGKEGGISGQRSSQSSRYFIHESIAGWFLSHYFHLYVRDRRLVF